MSVNPFTGNSFEEIVGEFNNMANIYRYNNLTNTAGIYQDPIGGYRMAISGNVKVGGDLCFIKKVLLIHIVCKICIHELIRNKYITVIIDK